MVIYLQPEKGDGPLQYLKPGNDYTVGRKNAEIIIQKDESISRQHALLKVGINDDVKIVDCKSKYGTFVNDQKLKPIVEVVLNDNDNIKFGAYKSIYVIKIVKLITTGSSLNSEVKNELKKLLSGVGITYKPNWSTELTHITVDNISLTLKVLHALIDGQLMVVPDFWRKTVDAINNNMPLPNTGDFKPPVDDLLFYENEDTQITVDPRRNQLFTGKTFIFATEKIKNRMEELIKKTGGECFAWETKQIDTEIILTSLDEYLFVKDEKEFVSNPLRRIHDMWTRETKSRVLPAQEIASAIFFCSCEKYCNPKKNIPIFVKRQSQETPEPSILAAETPSQQLMDIVMKVEPKVEVFVPASLDDDDVTYEHTFKKPKAPLVQTTLANAWKRTLDQNKENAQKRIKLDPSATTRNEIKASTSVSTPGDKNAVTTFKENTQTPLLKRKSDTPLDGTSAKKTQNPFTSLSSNKSAKSTVPNPFARLKIETSISEDNPFARPSFEVVPDRQRREATPERTTTNSTENVAEKTRKYSFISDQKIDDTQPSRDRLRTTNPPISMTEVDEQIREICQRYSEKFKDSVIIEKVPVVTRRSNIFMNSLNNPNVSNAGRNFKKFKKVMPITPRSRSLSTTSSVVCNSRNDTLEASMIQVESDCDDVEEEVRPVKARNPLIVRNPASKRFSIDI